MKLKTVCWALMPFAMTAFAGEMGQTSKDYLMSVSAGPGWVSPSTKQTIALQPDVVNAYVSSHPVHTSVLADGEVFLGVQHHFFQSLSSQFGLAFYMSSPTSLDGYIQVDGNPQFQNYAYQFKINHAHLSLKSKWIFEQPSNISPYVSGSMGVGFNRAYGYAMTPVIFQAVSMPPFQSHTQVALSYSVGVGFQRSLSQHVMVALGYQLVSWGSSHLGRASEQTSHQGLGFHDIYSQGIEFNLSYLL